ncbi:MAG: hypothetical protein SH850_03570 [Planctomycetaceae bacterium]|nr:hypothetical protein [Planctomycetaceae bacterium]
MLLPLSVRSLPFLFPNPAATVSIVSWGAILLASFWLPLGSVVVLIGLPVCAVLGLSLALWRRFSQQATTLSTLETPFRLAGDFEMFVRYEQLAASLLTISTQPDVIYRAVALEHLDDLVRRASLVAQGTFVFEGTETWRLIYERLLRSPGLHCYRSVAWVRTPDYWQDEPGRKSLAVNFELVESQRLRIERIVILDDALWPTTETWPTEPVRQWLHEQYARGIEVGFVRVSTLAHEPALHVDCGLYGSRALGVQQLDDRGQTERFTLRFDLQAVLDAEARWNRLAVYAESWANYLDRYDLPG